MNKFIFIILVLFPFFTEGQIISDAKLWTGFTASKKIEKFEFFASEEIRFDENFSHIDKAFIEIGGDYEIIKGLTAGLTYRFSRDNNYSDRTYDIKHRFDIGIRYGNKIKNVKWAIRTKIQTKPAESNKRNPTYSRTKFNFKYDLDKDFEPYVYYEFYYQFNDQQIINRNRTSVGVKYDINKKNAVKAFYIYENKFNTEDLEHNHIWGVSYSLDL